jgi:hypothetical protein
VVQALIGPPCLLQVRKICIESPTKDEKNNLNNLLITHERVWLTWNFSFKAHRLDFKHLFIFRWFCAILIMKLKSQSLLFIGLIISLENYACLHMQFSETFT